ncbi:MAG: hypothetical protein AAB966_02545 [Patescibacteria group bacterium]
MIGPFLPIIILLLTISLLIFVLMYAYFLHKRVTSLSNQEIHALDQSDGILKQAHEEAEKIVKKAMEDAEVISTNADSFKADLQKSMQLILKNSSSKYTDVFQKEIDQLLQSYRQQFVEKQEKYLKEAENLMNDEKLSSQFYLQKKVEEEVASAKKSIEQYKQEQLKQFDQKVADFVQEVGKKVLGHALDVKDQKELIFGALEQANKDGIFNI